MRIAALLAGPAILAIAASAQAQPAPSDRYPPSYYDRAQPSRGDADPSPTTRYADPRFGSAAAARDDDREDAGDGQDIDLARELNLQGAQLAALETYRAAFRPDEAASRRAQDMEARLPSMTTPQRLDFTRSEMERERADFERTDAATRRFYNQLSPEQRRTFDRLTAPEPEPADDQDDRPTPSEPARPR